VQEELLSHQGLHRATRWPTAAAFRILRRERAYLTLLMSTGLTFRSIAALFGLTHDLIRQQQYSELVTVVILSPFVPDLGSTYSKEGASR
jgi:Kef-type K+ transport system membrane component KefB